MPDESLFNEVTMIPPVHYDQHPPNERTDIQQNSLHNVSRPHSTLESRTRI